MSETWRLSARLEDHLFRGTTSSQQVIPAVIVTGFLGSGKTTLVQHLLRQRGNLNIAVLVNEVGEVDIDSQLVNLKQHSAATGVPTYELAGGCACCSVESELQKAAQQLKDGGVTPDYLVVETSGTAEPERIASLLRGAGFRLDCVVAVLDAESAADTLRRHPVAMKQVQLADVVMCNKCDLVGLGQISDLEDAIRELVPHARLLRARFGQVPLPAILDVHEEGAAPPRPGSSVKGEVAFLSHEPALVIPTTTYKVAAQPSLAHHTSPAPLPSCSSPTQAAAPENASTQTAQATHNPSNVHSHSHDDHTGHHHDDGGRSQHAAAGQLVSGCESSSSHAGESLHSQQQPHHPHHHLHASFRTVSVCADSPSSLAAFQEFVTKALLPCKDLFRAKALLWFTECRTRRALLHLSGRQRLDVRLEGRWDCPPGQQLVLIGSDAAALELVRRAFMETLITPSAASQPAPAGGGGLDIAALAVAGELEQLVAQHPRLQAIPDDESSSETSKPHAGHYDESPSSSCMVRFSSQSSQLHGVFGEEVNALMMRAINATGKLLVVGAAAPPVILTSVVAQQPDRINYLQVAVTASSSAADMWQIIQAASEPVLRRAFQHAHNCKCDMAGAMAGLR